jgi:hypothetical protein
VKAQFKAELLKIRSTRTTIGLVAEGLGFAVGYAGRGIHLVLNGNQITLLLLGTFAGTALWGAIGVGLGAILRSQVGAIIGLLAWGFVAENLLFAFIPSAGRFASAHASDALIGLTTKHLLHATAGGLMLAAWTAALALAGVALGARRDVN